MTGREALKALADGERVCWSEWDDPSAFLFYSDDKGIVWQDGKAYDLVIRGDRWERWNGPATDDDIAAAMDLRSRTAESHDASIAWRQAAAMLRGRKTKP